MCCYTLSRSGQPIVLTRWRTSLFVNRGCLFGLNMLMLDLAIHDLGMGVNEGVVARCLLLHWTTSALVSSLCMTCVLNVNMVLDRLRLECDLTISSVLGFNGFAGVPPWLSMPVRQECLNLCNSLGAASSTVVVALTLNGCGLLLPRTWLTTLLTTFAP